MSSVTMTDEELALYVDTFALNTDKFINSFEHVSKVVDTISKAKGFTGEDGETFTNNMIRNTLLIIMEACEVAEALRVGNPQSEKIPEFTQVEEELADMIIRIMDRGSTLKLRIAQAVVAKIIYNAKREHKHGGKLF